MQNFKNFPGVDTTGPSLKGRERGPEKKKEKEGREREKRRVGIEEGEGVEGEWGSPSCPLTIFG